MAPPKIYKWPAYVFKDPAVLKLDECGRFIVCRMCAEYYAACGGKKPKPIVLNGCYRMRAWEVHKQRTRAHNTSEWSQSSSTAPVDTAIDAPTANSLCVTHSFDGVLTSSKGVDIRPTLAYSRPSNRPSGPELRLPASRPPWSITTERPQRTHAFTETSRCQHQTSKWRVQPAPALQLALVFPLVRKPSELRRWSEFDPAWCESCPGYDWRRRPSDHPSSVANPKHAKSRSLQPRIKLHLWPLVEPATGAHSKASTLEKRQSNDYAF